MNTDLLRKLALCAAPLILAGCETTINTPPGAAEFGEPNRQTMMAQVIDPDPQYEAPAESSGEHAAQAVERYRTDTVKKPARTSSTAGSGGGGGKN